MAKSTIDDLLACYRIAEKLGRAYKIKLIALLTEDVSGVPVRPVKKERAKKEKPEEGKV